MDNNLDKMVELQKLHDSLYLNPNFTGVSSNGIHVEDCRLFDVVYKVEDWRHNSYNYRLSFVYNGVTFYSIHKEL